MGSMLAYCLSLGLLAVSATQSGGGFQAEVTVQEGDAQRRWTVGFGQGRLRITPQEGEQDFLLDVESREVIVLDREERLYCRMPPEALRELTQWRALGASWFPWAYSVSDDLVGDLSVEPAREAALPEGGAGLVRRVRHRRYGRRVAEYWLDPEAPRDVFFQWRDVYLLFFSEEDAAANEAQERRLELYDQLSGVPVRMEERFVLLSQPRITTLGHRETLRDEEMEIPSDYEEVDVSAFYWKEMMRRFTDWLTSSASPEPGQNENK